MSLASVISSEWSGSMSKRWIQWIAVGGIAMASAVMVIVGLLLAGSLPQRSGSVQISALSERVRIERDALGVPTIRATSRTDAYVAMGFLHAQERYFQMDLLRRSAAGELSELLPGTLDYDRYLRQFRFRHLAEKVYTELPASERELLEKYAAGVNQGLETLRVRPWEYGLLARKPVEWRPVDSLLVAYSMYLDLEGGDARTARSIALVAEHFSKPVFEFLCRNSTRWEAAMDGSTLPILPIPSSEHWTFYGRPLELSESGVLPNTLHTDANRELQGSNAWAIADRLTTDGHALLAGDPHLSLRVPNIWYRVDYQYRSVAGEPVRLLGVTIPGLPLVVIGSNTRVAWSMTVAVADTHDLVSLIPDPEQENSYLTPKGSRAITRVEERIRMRDGSDEILEILTTEYGPVVGRDGDGNPYALLWSGLMPDNFNLAMKDVDGADSVEELFAIAQRQNMPVQNLIAADHHGSIGWTAVGWIPEREGYDGFLPQSSNDPKWKWKGRLPADAYPSIINPPNGRVWNANNRAVGGEAFAKLGDGRASDQARGWIIQQALERMHTVDERDMHQLQLSNSAAHLERWYGLAELLLPKMPEELRAAVEPVLKRWSGEASVDSSAYALVGHFYEQTRIRVLGRILAPLKALDSQFRATDLSIDEALWLLVSEQPEHLVNEDFEDWDAELVDVMRTTVEQLEASHGSLESATHGRLNELHMQHPLASGIPLLGRWLNMPVTPMDGDRYSPNAQTRSHGPSLRMVVSPGQEAVARFTMPGGQSGHFLSPHYRDHHQLWVSDAAAPLLPGETVDVLQLYP